MLFFCLTPLIKSPEVIPVAENIESPLDQPDGVNVPAQGAQGAHAPAQAGASRQGGDRARVRPRHQLGGGGGRRTPWAASSP